MDFVWVVLGIAVVAVALYFTATILFGPGEPPQPAGEPLASPLPDGRDLTAADLRATVLPVTARGYRMSDVDALIERMAQQLARDEDAADARPGSRPTADRAADGASGRGDTVAGGEPHHGEPSSTDRPARRHE